MRTTIELPDRLHAQVKQYAEQHGQPMASVLGDLVMHAASSVGLTPATVTTSPATGLPVITLGLGHVVTEAEVNEALYEEPR